MPHSPPPPTRRRVLLAGTCASLLVLAGCAGFGEQAPRVSVAGVEPLAGQGLEMRMNLNLRVQNPSDRALDFNGISLDLDVNGERFASGVSDQSGSIPRYGETLVSVPVTISAMGAVRQLVQLADGRGWSGVPYVMRGRLSGGTFGTTRFSDSGTLRLPGM
ncbi:hypothetical protein FOZ76_11945 [Verticiella sediminum]|uniref:Water stress and hypersensitive response domain-containing protein n=1 Tax=Verticiella sediminum TaxID=1247510 RepID=A0A556APN5_9BURK|nr:LEA type 2 family protein [Verticiella sediminum]TSH94847.1 hypothetical protein FOZ76_11945 [Verticiella sediminum]